MSSVETEVSKHGQVRGLILAAVLDAVKQCQRHFGAGQGVATEADHRVVNLLNSLDTCLSHGVKRKAGKLKQAFVGRREESGAFWPAVKEVLSDFQFQRLKGAMQAEQSVDLSKANLGMVWLKVALNERNLQTVLSTLLAEKQIIHKFYEEHAFIRDEEKSSILPTSAAGLGSVIFALTVCSDSRGRSSPKPEERKLSPIPILNTSQTGANTGVNGRSSPLISQSVIISDYTRPMTYKTDPLTQSEKLSSFSTVSPSVSQPASFLQGDFIPEPVMNIAAKELVRKDSKSKKRSLKSVVQFESDTNGIVHRHKQKVDEWTESLTLSTEKTPTNSHTFEEISQNLDDLSKPGFNGNEKEKLVIFTDDINLTPDLSDRSSQLSLSDPEELIERNTRLVGELGSSPEKRSNNHTPDSFYTLGTSPYRQVGLHMNSAPNQLHMSTQEALNATVIALDASTVRKNVILEAETDSFHSQSLSEMSRGDLEALMLTVSKQNERIGDKNKQLKVELDREQRMNGMLRDEIELEQSEMKRKGDELSMKVTSISRENDLLKGQLKKYVGMVQSMEIRESMGVTYSNNPPQVNEVEKENDEKIVQLSDMYGELMELNDRLHKELILKDRVIQYMHDKMLSLGLQVPIFTVTPEIEQDSNQFVGEGILKREIVKIWIPSAFLKDDSYNVYQIYIRINNDEWNVYRRYTEFYEFHCQLRKKIPAIEKFDFPPKKNIGRKDARLVEERRQRLQSYLRYMVHVLSQSNSSSKPPIFNDDLNKQRFLELLPFFANPTNNGGSNRGSRCSSPAPNAARRNSAQPPKSPTYKGL